MKRITAQEAKILSNKEGIQFVDVRSLSAYQSSPIENAIHLDEQSLPSFIATINKTKPLIIYCEHGIQSVEVAYYLAHQGYERVYSLEGGIESWNRSKSSAD